MWRVKILDLLTIVCKAIDDRLGENISIIDMRNVSPFNDYMVICSAKNVRMALSIVDKIEQDANKYGSDVRAIEGDDTSNWILIDLYTIVAHVFVGTEREVYNLENLWIDQPRLKVNL